MPSVFPIGQIAITAGITTLLSGLLLFAMQLRWKQLALLDCLLIAVVAGCSVLFWRSAGNVGALNDDPLPGISPNDALCPFVTYLVIGWYTAFRRPVDASRFEQSRVLLTLICFVVNVVTI